MMQQPISCRQSIPFYTEKSSADYIKDPYERYDPMVIKQTALHLSELDAYQSVFDPIYAFAKKHYRSQTPKNIVDLGCGVGQWIGELSMRYPTAHCWGIDYSYQMLKRAHEYWVDGAAISIDLSDRGFGEAVYIDGYKLKNLQFGLAEVSNLPFEDDSQDLIVSSFLLDRLDDPIQGLLEMHRVMKPKGTLILATPLNFQQRDLWKRYYPPARLKEAITSQGFTIMEWTTDIVVQEPLDLHGNAISWKCLCMAAMKG